MALFFCVLAAAAAVILYLSLPGLVGGAIVSQAEKIGVKNLRFQVLHLGWGRLDLANLAAGDAAAPALVIPRLSLEYSPLGLWRRKIRRVRLTGAVIRVEQGAGGWSVPGLIGPPVVPVESGAALAIGRIEIKDGNVRLVRDGGTMDIPFAASLRAAGPGYSLSASCAPFGAVVRMQGNVDREFSSATISFDAAAIELGSLAGMFGPTQGVAIGGRVNARGEIRLGSAGPFAAAAKILSLGDLRIDLPARGELVLASLRLAFGIGPGYAVRDIEAQARGRRLRLEDLVVAAPFGLEIRGKTGAELAFVVSGADVSRPLPLLCERVNGKFVFSPLATQVSGDFRLRPGAGMPAALGLPWRFVRPFPLSGAFAGSRKGGALVWQARARGDGGIALSAGKNFLRGAALLDAAVAGDAHGANVRASCRLSRLDAGFPGGNARAEVIFGDAALHAGWNGALNGRGRVRLLDGRYVAAGSDGLKVEGIAVRLPWSYPSGRAEKSGDFSIARLDSGGMSAREISGKLGQDGKGVVFSGLAHTGLPEITVAFQGKYAPQKGGERLEADFAIPPAVLPAKTGLHALHPALRGVEAGGRLEAHGRIWSANGAAGSQAVLEIADCDLDYAGQGIALRGLQAGVRLESLFDFRTAPAQKLRFRQLRWQGNALDDGEVVFSAQGGGRLFIESGRFTWNHGTVTLDPLRLEPGSAMPPATFRCQGVDLAEMLNSLAGSGMVSGDALMSGVIPLKLVNGSPVFLDGYLDSAPGRGGRLQVTRPETVSGGQVLVEEAIRDFHYNWIKVRLSGRNDLLNMVVSIDGAPARKLPLRYDQKGKGFIRDPKGRSHVTLKGLRLDIRFDDIDVRDLLETGGRLTGGQREK